jgi:hypothetical protein
LLRHYPRLHLRHVFKITGLMMVARRLSRCMHLHCRGPNKVLLPVTQLGNGMDHGSEAPANTFATLYMPSGLAVLEMELQDEQRSVSMRVLILSRSGAPLEQKASPPRRRYLSHIQEPQRNRDRPWR